MNLMKWPHGHCDNVWSTEGGILRYRREDIKRLPLSVTRRDKIHEGVSRVLRDIFGVLTGC